MSKPETYLVLDEDGVVVNAVVWDGNKSKWSPGQGRETLRRADLPEAAREKGVGIGWRKKPGSGMGPDNWEDRRPENPGGVPPA